LQLSELEELHKKRESMLSGIPSRRAANRDELKQTFLKKKELYMRQIQTAQTQDALALSRHTAHALADIRNKTIEKVQEMQRLNEKVTGDYERLKSAYDLAIGNGDKTVIFRGRTIGMGDAAKELKRMSGDCVMGESRMKAVCLKEIEEEVKVMRAELEKLEEGTMNMGRWICEIEGNSVEDRAELEVLRIAEELISGGGSQSEVNDAFKEKLKETFQGNGRLVWMLNQAEEEIASLVKDLGGDPGKISAYEQLDFISEKYHGQVVESRGE
jgi:hypothetical protein